MAEVDFTNARIEPSGTENPATDAYVQLNTYAFYDSSTNMVNSGTSSRTQLINQQKQLMFLYQGRFTTSGTEFYIYQGTNYLRRWKVSNISFNSGDTYVFQINATLTCN